MPFRTFGALLRSIARLPFRKSDVSTLETGDHERVPARPPNSRRWTNEELATLRRLAWCMTASQIGVLLGRTALAVRTKAAHERVRLQQDKRSEPSGA